MLQPTSQWLGQGQATALLVLIGLATLVTLALFLVAAAATVRRRHTTYLLVTVAIGLLVVRSVIGFGTAVGLVSMPVHHLVGHGVDLSIALLVLAAIFGVGRPEPPE
jgi:hypothetical protein